MKIIILSDPHLGLRGESYSLLGAQVNRGGLCKAAYKLKEIINSIADRTCETGCIVVGDMVDLAMADQSAIEEDLAVFSEITGDYVNDVTLVAGNHDHHLYAVQEERGLGLWDDFIMGKQIYYPDYTPTIAKAPLYFVHGDIFDSPGDVLAKFLIDPAVVGDAYKKAAAGVTAPVTELIWWLLGNMGGQYGKDGLVAQIYGDLRKGDESLTKKIMRAGLEHMGYNVVEAAIGAAILASALQNAVGKAQTGTADARHQDTAASRAALTEWLRRTQYDTSKFGYVFTGHTHVEDLYAVDCANVYNLGSWMVEPGHAAPDCMVAVIDTDKTEAVTVWENCEA